MEDTGLNKEDIRREVVMEIFYKRHHKCKNCKWFDWYRCTEPERNRINKEKGWDYYRNFRRGSYEPACKRFEEKENDMLTNENLKDFQAVLDSTTKTLESMECMLDRELETRGGETEVEPKAPRNKYGIGETLYLPVTITGIRESVNGSAILYEVRTANDKRLGFKVFECASDIWRDKDHYAATIPESLLVKNFEEA